MRRRGGWEEERQPKGLSRWSSRASLGRRTTNAYRPVHLSFFRHRTPRPTNSASLSSLTTPFSDMSLPMSIWAIARAAPANPLVTHCRTVTLTLEIGSRSFVVSIGKSDMFTCYVTHSMKVNANIVIQQLVSVWPSSPRAYGIGISCNILQS